MSCDVAGCQASDLDIVGGGSSSAIATELCRTTGTVTQADLTYTLEVGATLTCPFFVTVLQPAKEGAHYTVRITPPALDTQQEDPTATPTSELTETGNTQLNNIPRPAPTATSTSRPSATATPTSTPTSLTPTSVVRGVRTPGPPATGSGKLIQRPGGSAGDSTGTWIAALLLQRWPWSVSGGTDRANGSLIPGQCLDFPVRLTPRGHLPPLRRTQTLSVLATRVTELRSHDGDRWQ